MKVTIWKTRRRGKYIKVDVKEKVVMWMGFKWLTISSGSDDTHFVTCDFSFQRSI